MNLSLDFSNVQGGNTILDEGVYNVTIETVEQKKSSTGKDMLLVRFREEESKAALFENYLLEEKCLWKLKELLSAAGFDTSAEMDFDTDDLIGLSFKAKVVVEDYNDSKVNRIKKILA